MPTETQTIKTDELKKRLDDKENIQVVNVLPPEYYDLGIIPGSLKIPTGELEERHTELDKSKPVVVYCAEIECDASPKAAQILAEKGYNVIDYAEGIKAWKEAGYPTE